MEICRRKLIIIGDGGVGKTSLFIKFGHGVFPEGYVPTVFANYVADLLIDQNNVELSLWDTPGQQEYDRLRPLSYPDSHIAFLAFSIGSPHSLENVQEKWTPELRHYLPKAAVILVGCKKDVRNDKRALQELAETDKRPISSEEGMAVAAKIMASQYLECSARTGEGVAELFDAAARTALEVKVPHKASFRKILGSCTIL
ncbi:P-loop containing nucleoside triphosphate hydrolase protein [Flagelloscypha sp. PMI_526]|nr:P-loop containing nucleoside triphosphate hydrolase protein [Flagelloscypha sp. PMI_526]